MNHCMRIIVINHKDQHALYSFVKNYAQQSNLEGVVQMMSENQTKLIICGSGEQVEEFVDALHVARYKNIVNGIEIEPFIKDKDYRGILRIID